MQNQDVIRVYQSLSPEFFEFRDAILDSSGFDLPDGIINLLESNSTPHSQTTSNSQEVPVAAPIIEVVPTATLRSWLRNPDKWKIFHYETSIKSIPFRPPCCPFQIYGFLMSFCESIIRIGPILACLEWTLKHSSACRGHSSPKEKVTFLHNVATSVCEGITRDSCLAIHDVIKLFFDRWDFHATKLAYGASFAQKSAKLDKYSSATTFTSRLFGAWYNTESSVKMSCESEHIRILRVLRLSQRPKNLGECLKHLFQSESKTKESAKGRYLPLSFPEIMIMFIGDNFDGHERNSRKRHTCVGFPQAIIFSSNCDLPSEATSYQDKKTSDVTCIRVRKSTAFKELYNIHSIGFFDETKEMNLCVANRVYSPDGDHEHGVWNETSYDKDKRIRVNLSSNDTLQKKHLFFACYVKKYLERNEELMKFDSENDVASAYSFDSLTIRNPSEDHGHVHSKSSYPAETTASSCLNAGNKFSKKRDNKRPLLPKQKYTEANSLPPEKTLGEPLLDEQWTEALDQGKTKKISKKRNFPEKNPFQTFTNFHQVVKKRNRSPHRENLGECKK